LRVAALALAGVLALLVGGALALFTPGTHPAHAQTPPERFVPGEVLVKFEPGASGQERAEAHRQNAGEVEEIIPDIGVRVVEVPVGREQSIVAAYERNPNVSYAEVNTIIRIADHPTDDPRVGQQWQYRHTEEDSTTGQEIDAPDIDAFEAWHVTQGTRDPDAVAIAILDTGIDLDHEDLQAKIAMSRNFTKSRTVNDKNGHGTHVAGSAAAVTNNGVGVAGTCPGCILYNGKVVGEDGSGKLSWLVSGIIWAANNDADVINMSLASSIDSDSLETAVDYAWDQGSVLVAAAGNDGGKRISYPAHYDNVIAVASTDRNDVKALSSNYGDWVDVAAPGVSILSTAPDHRSTLWPKRVKRYRTLSGTSMATPHVAGVAGLVWAAKDSSGAANLCSTKDCVRARIEGTADQITGTGSLWVHGRINANDAVTPPPPSST
jgi:thermitase